MDVWQWVWEAQRQLHDQGQSELAATIDELPTAAVDGLVDRVEALTPVAVAQARALRIPWIELYARHWRMQAYNSDERGAAVLPEVIDLFDLAHRDDCRSCPQSVCVTQDLCLIYGNTDGPGYAQQRIDVCEETMSRIDPSWSCFVCLTGELGGGLNDAGRHDDAVAAVLAAEHELLAAGEGIDSNFARTKAEILLRAGRPDDVIAVLDAMPQDWSAGRDTAQIACQMMRAEAHVQRGELERAAELLPTPGIAQTANTGRTTWTRLVHPLARAGAVTNDAELGGTLHGFIDHLRRNGAHRPTFDAAYVHADLAIRRGATWVAREALDVMVAMHAELQVDGGATAKIEQVQRALDDMAPTPAPVPPEALLDHLVAIDEHDIEAEAEWLAAAVAARPDDASLRIAQSQVWLMLQRPERAIAGLWEAQEALPDDESIAGVLGELLLGTDRHDEVARLATMIVDRHPGMSFFLRARSAYGRGDDGACIAWCERVISVEPDAENTRRVWAWAARRLGDHETALERWTELIAMGEEPGSDDWERMIDATALGRWPVVRASARRLGVEFDGDADDPIDEPMEPLVLVFDHGDADEQAVFAQRTGPVTARVLSIAPDDDHQHVADLVLFDASPLDPPADDEDREGDDGDEQPPTMSRYGVVKVLQPADCRSWVIDGVFPGEDAWSAFRQAVHDAGAHVWVFSDDTYELCAPDGDIVEGVYGRVAAPPAMDPAALDRLLHHLTASWRHPLSWIGLAIDAGADPAPHERIIDAYDL